MQPAPSHSSSFRHDLHTLYTDHHQWLLGWLCKRLRHAENAADLTQDTFLHVLGRPESIGELRQPRAWLSTIAKGLLVDRLRRRRVEQAYLAAIADLPEPEVPSPETRLILLETLLQLDALLDGLQPKVRSAFLLSRLEGMPYPSIAERLGVCVSSVEKYMATAIRHCYLAWQAYRGTP